MKKLNSYQQSGERYPALRVIGFVFTLFGALLMAASILLLVVGLYALAWGPVTVPLQGVGRTNGPGVNVLAPALSLGPMVALFWSFLLLLSGLQMIAYGTLCMLVIHLEENTRATAQVLDRIQSRLESSPEGLEPVFRS